jgi:hypothetical protein
MFLTFLSLIALATFYFRELLRVCLAKRKLDDWAALFFYIFVLGIITVMGAVGLEMITGPSYRPPVVVPEILQLEYWVPQFRGASYAVLILLIVSITVFIVKRSWARLSAKLVHTRLGRWLKIRVPSQTSSLSNILRENFTFFWWGFFSTLMFLLIALTGLTSGWWRFSVSIFTIFIVSILWYAYPFVLRAFGNAQKLSDTYGHLSDDAHPVAKHSVSLLYGFFPVILLILVYLRLVYPDVPQQLGGGSMLPVEIIASKDEVPQFLVVPNARVYLLDRTSDDTIFFVAMPPPFVRSFMQVPNSNIDAIIYKSR